MRLDGIMAGFKPAPTISEAGVNRVAKVFTEKTVGKSYRWYVLGLLWFCGFFNYADRQAVNAVFKPIQAEFHLDDTQLGLIGSAFMLVYASSSPFAGYLVDRVSRRTLIAVGLGFWSLICAATGLVRSFPQLIFLRAAEGLGESFYFPASMTLLADYHPPATRSRAMSIHQTSVYLGSAGGVVLGGFLGERFGWQSPFLVLGLTGMVFAGWLATQLVEPKRGQSEPDLVETITGSSPAVIEQQPSLLANLAEILTTPAALALLGVFVGANFVAAVFLTWLPLFIGRQFSLGLTASSLTSTVWPLASLFGALGGGFLADIASRRPGGRIRIQAFSLMLGSPFVFATGWAGSIPVLVLVLAAVGLCKGAYDANIFASLYDVIRPPLRGTAAGLMNSVGWTGGFLAPTVVGIMSDHFGLGLAIASTAVVYLLAGLLAIGASILAARQQAKSWTSV